MAADIMNAYIDMQVCEMEANGWFKGMSIDHVFPVEEMPRVMNSFVVLTLVESDRTVFRGWTYAKDRT
jgi:hypothetical protein